MKLTPTKLTLPLSLTLTHLLALTALLSACGDPSPQADMGLELDEGALLEPDMSPDMSSDMSPDMSPELDEGALLEPDMSLELDEGPPLELDMSPDMSPDMSLELDEGPPLEPPVLLEESEAPVFEALALSEAPISALYALNDHIISAQGGGALTSTPLSSLMNLSTPSTPLRDLSGSLEGELISVASLNTSEGLTELVLTTEGLYAARPPELRRSPLEGLISEPITALAALEGELWLATATRLYQWREGALREVQIEGVSFDEPPRLALGADFRGVRALWVACGAEEGSAEEGQLFAIERDHPDLRVWRVSSSLSLSHLGADSRGALWGASEGLLYRRSPSGVWSRYLLPSVSQDAPESVVWVSARPERAVAWVASEGGVWAAVSVGEDLALWSVSDVRWAQPTGVAQLLDPTQEAAVLWGAQGATLLTLPQEALPEPPPPPTWLSDVEPLSSERCGACHAAGGVGHHLERYEQWVEEFDLLFSNVTRAQMPLGAPPLTRSELELLRAWRDGGFLVGGE